MLDMLLTLEGDLHIDETGDISLTDSVRQAVKIRLLWFLGEWRFFPEAGVPYYEEILVKNPDMERIRRAIRDEVLSVDEVINVRNITIVYSAALRTTRVALDIVLADETYREEVVIDAGLRSDA